MAVQTVQSLRSVQAVQADQWFARFKVQIPATLRLLNRFWIFWIPKDQRSNLEINSGCAALMPSSLLTFSTKAQYGVVDTNQLRKKRRRQSNSTPLVLSSAHLLFSGDKRRSQKSCELEDCLSG